MKVRVVLMFAGAAMALAGCASSNTYTHSERFAPVTHQDDAAYIAEVEYLALRRGVDVHWINPPKRAVPVDQQH